MVEFMMKVFKNLNIKMELNKVSKFSKSFYLLVSNLHRMISIKKLQQYGKMYLTKEEIQAV